MLVEINVNWNNLFTKHKYVTVVWRVFIPCVPIIACLEISINVPNAFKYLCTVMLTAMQFTVEIKDGEI